MEKILKMLFDYQRIAENNRLAAMVSETCVRWKKKLNDDDLENVSAAGMIYADRKDKSDSISNNDFDVMD